MANLKIVLTAMLLIFTAQAQAKDKSGQQGLGSVGFTGGTTTAFAPNGQFDANAQGGFSISGETKLLGPFYVEVGLSGVNTAGKLKYDYIGTDAVHYLDDDVNFTMERMITHGGLKLRLLDFSFFHLYASGGGIMGTMNINYDVATNTTITGAGSQYAVNQKDIALRGGYVEAGLDVLVGKYGLRMAGRAMDYRTKALDAMAKQELKFKDAMGVVTIVVEF